KEEALEFHRIYMDACIDGIILYEKDGFLTNLMRAVKEKLTELGAKRVVMPNKRHYWVISKVKAGEVYQL
ncbi:MAG: nucleotidyltransferase domain-containing protein, partial [Candidatus Bathyarchaeia archaeon]